MTVSPGHQKGELAGSGTPKVACKFSGCHILHFGGQRHGDCEVAAWDAPQRESARIRVSALSSRALRVRCATHGR